MQASIRAVGDWSKEMRVPLSNAMAAAVDLIGKSGRQACEMAMVYMARSARAMTKQAKKNRKEMSSAGNRKYVEKFYKDSKIRKLYKHNFPDDKGHTWEWAKEIRARGLAKRSWFWGIAGLRGGSESSKPIPGVSTLIEILRPMECGLIMTNKLKYIFKAAGSGVEKAAADKASNQIMAQAAKKLERKFGVEVPRLAAQRAKKAEKKLAQAFREGKR